MIQIWQYHCNFSHSPYTMEEVKTAIYNSKYKHVATYFDDNMSNAYCLTQNFDHSWVETEEDLLSVKVEGGCRSTMIGDIMIKNGVIFMVDRVGFTELV